MIFGYNTEITYKNKRYHIQTEDRGIKHPVIETFIYHEGEIVSSKKQNYGHLLDVKDLEKRVKKMLEEQHNSIISNIKKGEYDTLFGIEETQEIKLEQKLAEETLSSNKKEQKINNDILGKIKDYVNNLQDEDIFYNIHYPTIDFDETTNNMIVAGKITIYRTKKPLINTPVEITLTDKKGNKLSYVEVKTNYYGGFRTQLLSNSKPYWIKIKVKLQNNKDSLSATFHIK